MYVWAFAVALASAMGRAITGRGSRADYWTAAFVCSVGAAGALLALIARDVPVGFVEVALATAAGAAVVLYVWAIGRWLDGERVQGHGVTRRLAQRDCRRNHPGHGHGHGRGDGGVAVVVHDPSLIGREHRDGAGL